MDNDAKVNYNVKARKVQELMKPELNDEFAKIADPNAKTLKELKNKIQKQSLNHQNQWLKTILTI